MARGFRVTTNSTLFDGASPLRMREFFDEMMNLGVEGMMVSPGYSYSKAPDQEHFLLQSRTHELFSRMLSKPKKRWRFNQSPLFLRFLMGKKDFECTPWGNPTFNIFGWQKPCYLLQEGYADTFDQLMSETQWANYGRASGNPKCANCMVHCGYEGTAVADTVANPLKALKVALTGIATEGEMAPEIDLSKQRPAVYAFEDFVAEALKESGKQKPTKDGCASSEAAE